MMGRNRRNGRANPRTRIAIAAAAVVGGGAVAIAAVAATSHGSPAAAQSASYSSRSYTSEWNQLNSAMHNWGSSPRSAYSTLAGMTQQAFTQTTQHGRTFAAQRGIVVLATSKFIILQSANGSLHLWLLSGQTAFQNVTSSTSATAAMTASSSAAQQIVQSNYMIPATELMAGGPLVASRMLTPSTAPQSVTVNVAGTDLSVTVTIQKNTATVSQTATMPASGTPFWSPATSTQSAWMTAANSTLARGDLALIVGFRSHQLLHAQLVLFAPLTTADVGGAIGHFKPAPAVTSTIGASGTHY
jgi:ribosomal protein S11